MPKDDTPYDKMVVGRWKGPPYCYKVWIKGERKAKTMSGFDTDHIRLQIEPKIAKKIQKLKDSD